MKKRVDKVKLLLEKLPGLQNPHAEFTLLKNCFSLPKVSYLLRTCPPSVSCRLLWESFDGMIWDSLNIFLGASVSDSSWAQAKLTVKKGVYC